MKRRRRAGRGSRRASLARLALGVMAAGLGLGVQGWALAPSADARTAVSALPPIGTAAAPADEGGTGAVRAANDSSWEPTVRYRLEASLDVDAHRVDGRGSIQWHNRSALPQRVLYLHLYLNAFQNERSLFMRQRLGDGFRGGGQPSRWGRLRVQRLWAPALERDLWPAAEPVDPDGEDETDWRVPLPRAVPPGGALELEASWTVELPSVVLRTGFYRSFHMVAQWFPKLARLEPDGHWAHFRLSRLSEFYSDHGSYDVQIDVPAGFSVGATGERRGGPVAVGDRRIHHYVAERVGDFAFAAYDGFAEQRRRGPGGVQMRCLYPRGESRAARIELGAAARGLSFFGERYGAYPYRTLTIVHPPAGAAEAGGMEYPTLITTGGGWYWPLLGVRALEGVTVHELAHQWFYGLVGSNENRWPFLDEGLTSFATIEALESWWPHASALGRAGHGLSRWALSRAHAAQVWMHGAIGRSAPDFVTGGDYGGLVYARTATLLETLARVYGRERLTAALGAYARAQRFGHPGPSELIAAVTEHLGVDAADNLTRGLLRAGWVDFAVAEIESEPRQEPQGLFDGGIAPQLVDHASPPGAYLGHVLVRRMGDLKLPVTIALHAADGSVRRVRWRGESDHLVVPYGGPSPLVAAVVDPDLTVLIDNDLSNNARRVDGRGSTPRLASTLLAAANLLLTAVAP